LEEDTDEGLSNCVMMRGRSGDGDMGAAEADATRRDEAGGAAVEALSGAGSSTMFIRYIAAGSSCNIAVEGSTEPRLGVGCATGCALADAGAGAGAVAVAVAVAGVVVVELAVAAAVGWTALGGLVGDVTAAAKAGAARPAELDGECVCADGIA
jgi:hypothetical protein